VTVEGVEHFTAEIHFDPLRDRNGFVDTEIFVVEREATDVGELRGMLPKT